jgi:hypothetical protein
MSKKTYNDWQRVSRESIHEELFCDVVAAIGVLKRQVEFVIAIEDVKTFIGSRSRTFVIPASSVNIHLNVFSQFMSELQSIVPCRTIRHEPSNLEKK